MRELEAASLGHRTDADRVRSSCTWPLLLLLLLLLLFSLLVVNCDLDCLNAEPGGYVDGKAHEMKSKTDVRVSVAVHQMTTDWRLLQRLCWHLVAAQVKHMQRLYALLNDKLNS